MSLSSILVLLLLLLKHAASSALVCPNDCPYSFTPLPSVHFFFIFDLHSSLPESLVASIHFLISAKLCKKGTTRPYRPKPPPPFLCPTPACASLCQHCVVFFSLLPPCRMQSAVLPPGTVALCHLFYHATGFLFVCSLHLPLHQTGHLTAHHSLALNHILSRVASDGHSRRSTPADVHTKTTLRVQTNNPPFSPLSPLSFLATPDTPRQPSKQQ